jgi:4-amino-4-deoxy-L-arabinose transferase-like glycosyltransferase
MPASPATPVRRRTLGWTHILPAVIALVAFAYAGGHLAWYRETPLGQVPVMDEQENLMLGEMIVRGELPTEPFYRAMGYPLMLAALRVLGVPTSSLFSAALVLGMLLHALNAAFVATLARRWFGRAGAALAGLLFALNPTLVHYATQALDATPALALFLIGLCFLTPELLRDARAAPQSVERSSKAAPAPEFAVTAPCSQEVSRVCPVPVSWRWIGASVAWAAATAVRPNYLLVWLVVPLLVMWVGRRVQVRALAAALSGILVFAAVASWQWRVSEVAGFLPWQGAYNLWAANRPESHGRYFVQRVSLPSSASTLNPTRAESIFLFRQETGAAPADVRALNRYWRGRFVDHITRHPLSWLGALSHKTYALFNDWEQYNNKTFAFHRARSPWLRWNPLGWGIVFVLGLVGALRLWREHPRAARALAFIATALVASIVLFFVSGRFRIPLTALATILAGGVILPPRTWRGWSRRQRMRLGVALAIGAGLTYSNLGGVRDRTTFVEDHALLARAAERTGDAFLAWNQAAAALALNPNHRDATRVAVASFFNHLVRQGKGPGTETQWLEISRRFLAARENDALELQAIAVVAMWRANQRVDAVEEWRRLGGTPSAIAGRMLVGDRTVSPADLRLVSPAGWTEPLVRLAGARFGIQPPPGIAPGDPRRAADVLQSVFGR